MDQIEKKAGGNFKKHPKNQQAIPKHFVPKQCSLVSRPEVGEKVV